MAVTFQWGTVGTEGVRSVAVLALHVQKAQEGPKAGDGELRRGGWFGLRDAMDEADDIGGAQLLRIDRLLVEVRREKRAATPK